MKTKHDNRQASPGSNRLDAPVSNRVSTDIDKVMLVPTIYKQAIAESYHEIDLRSNSLIDSGYTVVSVTPIISGRFVLLGKK